MEAEKSDSTQDFTVTCFVQKSICWMVWTCAWNWRRVKMLLSSCHRRQINNPKSYFNRSHCLWAKSKLLLLFSLRTSGHWREIGQNKQCVGYRDSIGSSGKLQSQSDHVFLRHLHKRIVVGCVDSDAFNGSSTKNPFHFKHYQINNLELYYDSVQIPTKPLKPHTHRNP